MSIENSGNPTAFEFIVEIIAQQQSKKLNYSIKCEILSHKTVEKIKKRNIIRI